MTQPIDKLTKLRPAAGLADVLTHVVAAPRHPHMRKALKQYLLDRGLAAGEVDQHLEDWSRGVVRVLAALLGTTTDEP